MEGKTFDVSFFNIENTPDTIVQYGLPSYVFALTASGVELHNFDDTVKYFLFNSKTELTSSFTTLSAPTIGGFTVDNAYDNSLFAAIYTDNSVVCFICNIYLPDGIQIIEPAYFQPNLSNDPLRRIVTVGPEYLIDKLQQPYLYLQFQVEY